MRMNEKMLLLLKVGHFVCAALLLCIHACLILKAPFKLLMLVLVLLLGSRWGMLVLVMLGRIGLGSGVVVVVVVVVRHTCVLG